MPATGLTNTKTLIVGIDPGLGGGLAAVRPGPDYRLSRRIEIVATRRMFASLRGALVNKQRTVSPAEVARWIEHVNRGQEFDIVPEVWIEMQWARPGQSIVAGSTMMFGYGLLIGALLTAGFTVYRVSPVGWMNAILGPSQERTKVKKPSVPYLQQVYPDVTIVPDGCRVPHTGITDAICIAEYGCRDWLTREDAES